MSNNNTHLYWLNTTYACGGIFVRNNIIIRSCPIYTNLRGISLSTIKKSRKFISIKKIHDNMERKPCQNS